MDMPKHVMDMKNILDHNYSKKITLDYLESEFGISKYRLCHDFSRYMGIPPLQYLNHRRLEAARLLLLQSDECVHRIGEKVGIPNTNHFIRLFERSFGTTPQKYRLSHKPEVQTALPPDADK